MVNRNHFDARNLRPRAPESPEPAFNHQLSPALDQITSEGELHPSASCYQFTAVPAPPQSRPVFTPDQITSEGELHPSASCHQFTTFPAAPQSQPVFTPDQFTFESEFHPSTSCHQLLASSAVPQYQPVFAPASEQGRVNNNFPFGFNENILAQGSLPLPRSSSGLTNQHSDSLTNFQPAIFRSKIDPAITNPQATMSSDAMTDNTLLDPTTQAQLSAAAASSSPAPGSASPARLTIIGAAELEVLRKHNRILRSNNISIMKLKTEMEVRVLAAERKVELLERELRELREVRGGL